MTATQPDSDRGLTRRGVMRRTALGIGAAATLGAVGTGGAAAVNLPSRDTIVTAAGFAISPPLMGAKYVYDRLTDTGTGEDVNDELADLNATETHTSIRSDSLELYSVDDRVLTSINNVVQGLDRRAYQKGIEVAIEGMDLGDTQSTVKSDAIAAAMKVVSTTQKNLLDHHGIQAAKIHRLVGEAKSTTNLAATDVFTHADASGSPYTAGTFTSSVNTLTITLADNTSYTYTAYTSGNDTGGSTRAIDEADMGSYALIFSEPVDTGSQETAFDRTVYRALWNTIDSIGTTVENEITSWVDGIYPSYEAGDVNLDELVTADQLAATASEQNDLSNVTADFATLGIPINNRTTLTVEIVAGDNSGTIIDGNLAVRSPPTDGFVVGDTYDPANISGPVWLMYDRTTDSGETEGDVYQLKKKFKVINAEGYDGQAVSNVTFEEKTQERYSTDVQALNEELDRLAQLQQEIIDERDALIEEETSGGGGFLSGDTNYGLLAAGAGALALGWGYLTGEGN